MLFNKRDNNNQQPRQQANQIDLCSKNQIQPAASSSSSLKLNCHNNKVNFDNNYRINIMSTSSLMILLSLAISTGLTDVSSNANVINIISNSSHNKQRQDDNNQLLDYQFVEEQINSHYLPRLLLNQQLAPFNSSDNNDAINNQKYFNSYYYLDPGLENPDYLSPVNVDRPNLLDELVASGKNAIDYGVDNNQAIELPPHDDGREENPLRGFYSDYIIDSNNIDDSEAQTNDLIIHQHGKESNNGQEPNQLLALKYLIEGANKRLLKEYLTRREHRSSTPASFALKNDRDNSKDYYGLRSDLIYDNDDHHPIIQQQATGSSSLSGAPKQGKLQNHQQQQPMAMDTRRESSGNSRQYHKVLTQQLEKVWKNGHYGNKKSNIQKINQLQPLQQLQAFQRQTKHGNQVTQFRIRKPLKSDLLNSPASSSSSSSQRMLRSNFNKPRLNGLMLNKEQLEQLAAANLQRPSSTTMLTNEQKSIRSSGHSTAANNNDSNMFGVKQQNPMEQINNNNMSMSSVPDVVITATTSNNNFQTHIDQQQTGQVNNNNNNNNRFDNISQTLQQITSDQLLTPDNNNLELKLSASSTVQRENERDASIYDQLLLEQQQKNLFSPTKPATKLGFEPDDGETLACRTRKYTYRAVKTDSKGNKCWDQITANVCYGRCDSAEIADYSFPHKKSIHHVCVHKERIRQRIILSQCTSSFVDPDLRLYHYMDAVNCACQKCSSSNAVCRGGLVVDPPASLT